MKSFITIVCLLAAVVFVVPAFAGEEPYKAVVDEDANTPVFYISPKLDQFLHIDTDYLNERFVTQTVRSEPEVCCTQATRAAIPPLCPDQIAGTDALTSLTSAGNSGWYEWWIQVPKKPEGELNIELECGVLKPNSEFIYGARAIEICAAETGEIIYPNCTRKPGSYLKPAALPTIEAVAYPGCQNSFYPFHLTAYRNPGSYLVTRNSSTRYLANSVSLQVLDGGPGARIALKGCMDKTILAKWPKDGEGNAWGEIETSLRAGDIIKVRMYIPNTNTADVYCNKYSAKIGGIGEPATLLSDANCPVVCFDFDSDGFCDTCPDVVVPYGKCD